VPPGVEIIALTRDGQAWSSSDLARYFEQLALSGKQGAAFLIGGALGLSQQAIARAQRRLSLSAMTLTHEMARALLTEQIYRAGTITRGEPYHKARG
jgi:23S rRNA (pseudouridine1915-N3)-methyltransferase